MEFEPIVVDELEELGFPTEDEHRILREETDPDRVILGRVD